MPRKKTAKPDPLRVESLSTDLHRLIRERAPGSEAELDALMKELLNGGIGGIPGATPLERAQDLAFQAVEESRPAKRIALARQALAISPDCADAYIILSEESTSLRESHALIVEAVAAGARSLGSEMEALVADGHMWLEIESRPYLRALDILASLEWSMGDRVSALERGWELLRLNPNDNQGVRYAQLTRLMTAGSLEQIDRLLAMYADDVAAAWMFGRALHLYRSGGPGPEADKALQAAKKANRHVVPYLLGEIALPATLPDYIGFGDETEAASYATDALLLWADTPGVMEWLESKRGPSRVQTGKKRK